MTVAGYMASQIDSYATTEELFGSVLAEPEWWSMPNGFLYQCYTNLTHSSRPVPLSVYEVNINIPGGAITNSQAALTSYTPSLGAGLAVADHMLLMMRELKIRDQGLFSLPGYEANSGTNWSLVWSIVHDMGVTDRKRPVYLATQLANHVLDGDMVQTAHSGDNPTWSVSNVNHVTYYNAHYLQSFAFAYSATQSVVVFNLHRSNPLDIVFDGSLAPTGSVTIRQLTSANITDNNETSNTVAITEQTSTNFIPTQTLTLPPYSMTTLQWALVQPRISAITAHGFPDPVEIYWESVGSKTYQVQYSSNLASWADAGPPTAASTTLSSFLDDGTQTGGAPPHQAGRRFYRILLIP